MPCCVVRGCICRRRKRDPSSILHIFPKEPEKIKYWLQQTGQYGAELDKMVEKVYLGKINDTYRMCSLHFTNDCYNYDGNRRSLKKNSVPTVFNTINPATVSSVSGLSSSSNKQHIRFAAGQTPNSAGPVCKYKVEFPDVRQTSAPVVLQKHSSPVLTNSSLPSDSKFRPQDTSSSTKTPSSNTSSSIISSSGFEKSAYTTTTPMSNSLTVSSETKPCSVSVLPVSGKVSSGAQKKPTSSSLAQKSASMSVVQIPLKPLTLQAVISACLPPSKKRKLEENCVYLEPRTASSSHPDTLPSHSISQTSVNKGKVCFASSSASLVPPSYSAPKPLMVDKAVNTDFFTNKSCCISTDSMNRKRNANTQTKIYRKHRKIMCSLSVASELTNDSDSTVSLASPEHIGFSDCSSSRPSDGGEDVCEDLDLFKVEILSDSEVDASVPTSSDEKQARHIKEENESSEGQTLLSPTHFKSTFTIPDFDISKVKIEPNIKTEDDQFPISTSEQNVGHLLSQNPNIERNSQISYEPLTPGCRNPTSGETSAIKTEDEPEDPNDSFHINEMSEDEDESFLVPSDAEDEDDVKRVFQDLDSPVENLVEEEKYIVFESCLQKLIMMIPCTHTKCTSPLTQYRKETVGSYLSIEVRCRSGHTQLLWESQPRHGYQPLGNVLLSAAVLFSGSSFLKSQHMFKLLNVKSIDKTTYYKNQSMYLFPAISHHWKKEQKAVLQNVQERPLCLAGDQQLDNPGFSAKYSIYSLMDVASKKICSFSVEPVTPQVTLEGLEKIGFQKAMGELQTKKADVKMIVTDRSVAVQEVLKDNYPGIVHKLDLWHLSKSIGNEVLMAAKHKDCEILHQWVEAIRNHIWWSSCTCCKNPDLLIQKWISVIQHVANVHEWEGDSDCRACHHPPLPEEVVNNTNWLAKDSAAYKRLKNIVENKSLLNNLKQLSFRCHAGELDIYHRTCLKYRPKMLHFFMDSMVARTQLAALDHNRNVHRVKTVVENASGGDVFDTMSHKLEASKGQKSWIMKALYKPTCQNFLFDIINDVIAFVKEEKTFL